MGKLQKNLTDLAVALANHLGKSEKLQAFCQERYQKYPKIAVGERFHLQRQTRRIFSFMRFGKKKVLEKGSVVITAILVLGSLSMIRIRLKQRQG